MSRRALAAVLLRQGSRCWRCDARLDSVTARLIKARTGAVLALCGACRADAAGTSVALRERGIT